MFVEHGLTPSMVKDGFPVLKRDGRQHFFNLSCPGEGSGKVRCWCIPPGNGEEGVEVFFLSFITDMVGEKLYEPLGVARGRLTSPQAC